MAIDTLPIVFPGEFVAPEKSQGEDVPSIGAVNLEQLARYGYFASNIETRKNDPTLLLNSLDPDDLDWYIGVITDEDASADDPLVIGRGATIGDSRVLEFGSTGALITWYQPDQTTKNVTLTNSVSGSGVSAIYAFNITQNYIVGNPTISMLAYTYRQTAFKSVLSVGGGANASIVFGSTTEIRNSVANGSTQFFYNAYMGPTRAFIFAKDTTTDRTALSYTGGSDTMNLGPTQTGAALSLFSGSATAALLFDSSQDATFTGSLTTQKGRVKNTTRVTTTYTILVTDDVIFANTDSAGFTATLPAGVEGQTFKIINSGSSVNNLTVAPNGAEDLLGANSNFTLFDGDALIITYNSSDGWY